MQKVKVISVEDAGFFSNGMTYGNTVKVTLQRGEEVASCDGILIFEREQVDNDLFNEWKELALAGEEGYTFAEGA